MSTSDGSISYNSQELHNLAANLDRDYKTIDNQIEDIISEAKNLSSSGKWTGDMYEAFMKNIQDYKQRNIDPLMDVIKDYIAKIEAAAQKTEATTQAGIARFM